MGELLDALIALIEKLGVKVKRSNRNDHNWPAVTATEKLDMHLPTEYPFRLERLGWLSWPPFTGMRVELGAGCS